MGLFNIGKTGGYMNVIRCDQDDYLIWKWRPEGAEINTTSRENAIRWGSSLRVKDGEVAVFLYRQPNGVTEEFIEGPFDDILKTNNLPIIADLVQTLYGKQSPFQAEIYFINLAKVVQLNFCVPYFEIQDPRYADLPVPVSVAGVITFCVGDYRNLIKANRMREITLDELGMQVGDVVKRRTKGLITNLLYDMQCSLVQIERNIDMVSDVMRDRLKDDFNDFGVEVRRCDVTRIDIDKEDENWQKLQKVTAQYTMRATELNQDTVLETTRAQADANIRNIEQLQAINAENLEETLRIQREEMQYAQRLASQQGNMGAYGASLQAGVLTTAAENMGQMGNMNMGMGGGGGFNPAGVMTGMALGGAMGQQMAGMMGQMGQTVQQGMQQTAGQQPGMPGMPQTPPPVPGAPAPLALMVAIGGNASGPYDAMQLQQLAAAGHLTPQTYVWAQGMPDWVAAGTLPALQALFAPAQPAAPAHPQMPPIPGSAAQPQAPQGGPAGIVPPPAGQQPQAPQTPPPAPGSPTGAVPPPTE